MGRARRRGQGRDGADPVDGRAHLARAAGGGEARRGPREIRCACGPVLRARPSGQEGRRRRTVRAREERDADEGRGGDVRRRCRSGARRAVDAGVLPGPRAREARPVARGAAVVRREPEIQGQLGPRVGGSLSAGRVLSPTRAPARRDSDLAGTERDVARQRAARRRHVLARRVPRGHPGVERREDDAAQLHSPVPGQHHDQRLEDHAGRSLGASLSDVARGAASGGRLLLAAARVLRRIRTRERARPRGRPSRRSRRRSGTRLRRPR